MTNGLLNQNIPELVDLRIRHTMPAYGPGKIAQAYLTDSKEIYVRIAFDNGREANPFSLIKCIKKGLLVIEKIYYDEKKLNQLAQEAERWHLEAKRMEAKARQKKAMQIEAERKREMEMQRRRQEEALKRQEAEQKIAEQKRQEELKKQEEEWLAEIRRELEESIREKEQRREEWLRTARIENEQQLAEKKEIFDYLTGEREVKFLVHFTPESNLKSILEHGIMTRFDLEMRGIHADTPDEERFDNRTDYSSFSISFPNYRVFYSKRNYTPYTYVLLIIDPQIIMDSPLAAISYLPDNAASGTVCNVEEYTGLAAAKALFPESVKIREKHTTREELAIPDWFPTNPQAEVFVRTTVEPKYIRSIITMDSEQANRIKTKLQSLDTYTPKVIVNKTLYSARNDYTFWTAPRDTEEE